MTAEERALKDKELNFGLVRGVVDSLANMFGDIFRKVPEQNITNNGDPVLVKYIVWFLLLIVFFFISFFTIKSFTNKDKK